MSQTIEEVAWLPFQKTSNPNPARAMIADSVTQKSFTSSDLLVSNHTMKKAVTQIIAPFFILMLVVTHSKQRPVPGKIVDFTI